MTVACEQRQPFPGHRLGVAIALVFDARDADGLLRLEAFGRRPGRVSPGGKVALVRGQDVEVGQQLVDLPVRRRRPQLQRQGHFLWRMDGQQSHAVGQAPQPANSPGGEIARVDRVVGRQAAQLEVREHPSVHAVHVHGERAAAACRFREDQAAGQDIPAESADLLVGELHAADAADIEDGRVAPLAGVGVDVDHLPGDIALERIPHEGGQ